MAISLVQFKKAPSGGSGATSVTLTSPISAGSLVVVATYYDGGVSGGSSTSISVTNDKSDAATHNPLGSYVDVNGVGSDIHAFLAPTAGAQTFTATPNSTSNFAGIAVWEVSGLTGPVFDKVVKAYTTGSPTTPSSGSTGTLSSASEFAIGFGQPANTFTAAGSGWTSDLVDGADSGNVYEHQILSATTAIAATGTNSGASATVWCATFMSGSSGTTMTAAQGSFTETGEAALFAEKMPAAQGSFTETGEAAGLVQGTKLTSAQGSFTETGEAALFAETMPAAQGSFTETGEAAGFIPGTVLAAAQGSFTETGEAALFAEVMPAAQGSFTLTGEPATLSSTSGSTLTAAFGSFTLTGEAAGLVLGTRLTAAQGSFTLTGEAALFAEAMPAAQGSYTLTGEPATLTATSSNSLTAAFGSFTLTGEGALFAEAMPATQGSYTLTGEAAGLVQGTVFTAAQGSYVLTGEPVTFTAGTSVLAAATGHYVLTGHAAILTASGSAAAPLPNMKPYQPRAYPQITTGIPMWHTGQNNDISASVASMIETIKILDARLRTGGL